MALFGSQGTSLRGLMSLRRTFWSRSLCETASADGRWGLQFLNMTPNCFSALARALRAVLSTVGSCNTCETRSPGGATATKARLLVRAIVWERSGRQCSSLPDNRLDQVFARCQSRSPPTALHNNHFRPPMGKVICKV